MLVGSCKPNEEAVRDGKGKQIAAVNNGVVCDDECEPMLVGNCKPKEKAVQDGKGEPMAAGGNEVNNFVICDEECKPMCVGKCYSSEVNSAAAGSNVSIKSENEGVVCDDTNHPMHAVNESNEKVFSDSCKDGGKEVNNEFVCDDECEPMLVGSCEPNEKAVRDGKGKASAAAGLEVHNGVVCDDECEPMLVGNCEPSDSDSDSGADSNDSNKSFAFSEGESERIKVSVPNQWLQCHQQRIKNMKDDIEQLKLVSAELGEGITSYKLLASELTEGVDTKVSIKCKKNLTFTIATGLRNGVQEMVAQDYKKVMLDREILLYDQTAFHAQAYQCGIPLDSAQFRDNPAIRLVQQNLAVNSFYLQQIEARRVTNETIFLQQVQALKAEIISIDPECLAVNAALAAWPSDEIPKIIGSAKREGAQEQSGEGSALLSKTNNHNATRAKASAGKFLTQNGPVRKDRLRPGKN